MTEIADIREALASALDTIENCQVSAWMVRNPVVPSLMVVGVESIEWDAAFARGADTLTMTVQGLASQAESTAGQQQLSAWCAPSGVASVKAAIEADTTLGGIVDHARVTRYTGDKVFRHDSLSEVVGGEWLIEIDLSN